MTSDIQDIKRVASYPLFAAYPEYQYWRSIERPRLLGEVSQLQGDVQLQLLLGDIQLQLQLGNVQLVQGEVP